MVFIAFSHLICTKYINIVLFGTSIYIRFLSMVVSRHRNIHMDDELRIIYVKRSVNAHNRAGSINMPKFMTSTMVRKFIRLHDCIDSGWVIECRSVFTRDDMDHLDSSCCLPWSHCTVQTTSFALAFEWFMSLSNSIAFRHGIPKWNDFGANFSPNF